MKKLKARKPQPLACGTCGNGIKYGATYAWWPRSDSVRCNECDSKLTPSELADLGECVRGIHEKPPRMGAGGLKMKKPIPGQTELFPEID